MKKIKVYEVWHTEDNEYNNVFLRSDDAVDFYGEALKKGRFKIVEKEYGIEHFQRLLNLLSENTGTIRNVAIALWNALSAEKKQEVFDKDIATIATLAQEM